MRQIDVKEVMSKGKYNRFVILIIVLCAIVTTFDGYDQNIMGVCMTNIKAEYNVDSVVAGYMSSASIFGVLFGAIGCGILSDIIGRKKVLVMSLTVFAVFTGITALTHTVPAFIITRFLTGIGLGGVYPAAFATATEYAPAGRKALTVSLVGAGMYIGMCLAGVLSLWLQPTYGWRVIFIICALPLVTVPLILKHVPETMPLYIKKNDTESIKKVLAKMNPEYIPAEDDEFIYEISDVKSGSFAELFRDGRARNTTCFILLYSAVVFIAYALMTWLPDMMVDAGYSMSSGLTSQLVMNCGVLTGGLLFGFIMDKFGFRRFLMVVYAMGAIFTYVLSTTSTLFTTMLVLIIVGACTSGAQNLNQAYVSASYPAELRGTMLGWGLGLARLPGMASPILLGYFSEIGLPLSTTFAILALLPLIAFACVAISKDVATPAKKKS